MQDWAAEPDRIHQPLSRFLQALREADVRVSVGESIEAFRAAEIVGYADRQLLKDSLGLVLAKTMDEKDRFDIFFDQFFARASFAGEPKTASAETQAFSEAVESPLAKLLLADDRVELAQLLERAAIESGVERIRYFTQIGFFSRRIQESMGLGGLEQDIARAMAMEGGGEIAGALATKQAYLRQQVRDFVERQLAVQATGANERMRDDFLQNLRLTNIERRDFARLQIIVRDLAKRLATRHSRIRRRDRRGQLDLRRTLRVNMRNDGLLFRTIWKQRQIERPRIIAICDVSGSVATVVQFLLLFLYSLNEVLSDIKCFAFSSDLLNVSDILENEPLDKAIPAVLHRAGFGSTNYGRVFEEFTEEHLSKVDHSTSVILMGDARGNYTDPRPDLLLQIAQRSRRLIWLNPEPESFWGTGDSEMRRYRPLCHKVMVCNTIRQLERVIADVLHD